MYCLPKKKISLQQKHPAPPNIFYNFTGDLPLTSPTGYSFFHACVSHQSVSIC